MVYRLAIVVAVVSQGACLAASPGVSKLRLVPFPREVHLSAGGLDLSEPLVLETPEGTAETLGRQLTTELKRFGLGAVQVRATAKASRAWRLLRKGADLSAPKPPAGEAGEAYELIVRPEGAACAAAAPAGLYYGLATFCQLVRANRTGRAIPCLTVRDAPALRWRCFQDDLTRGPSSRIGTLRRDVAIGSRLKMNLFTYYMEHQYAFRKHPLIGPKDGSLTPEDLRTLVAFAKARHVDVLGNQQSFGHFSNILKHERYAPLRETPSLLCPVKEASYRLLDDLYSEVAPLLPFEFFNVCCDETWGLGRGPSKALAKDIGVGGVYVRHIRRVHDLLKDKYRKRMMMWGDIILGHPDHLKDVPKDTIMLTWGYGARKSFEGQIIPFAKSGYEFFVCPGVSNWSRILPDFGVATTNIHHFVRDGVRHGAMGMLNTAWEDDGESLNAPKWHGYAWGAECAWTGSATTPEDFNRRIGAVLFGEKGDHFGRAVELLAQTHRLAGMGGMNNRRFWKDDFAPTSSAAAVRSRAGRLLAIVQPAIEHLEACRAEAVVHAELLDGFLLGARRMERIGLRMLDGLAAAEAYALACDGPRAEAGAHLARAETLVRRNRDAHEALGKEFTRLWLGESKPYALDWTQNRYRAVRKRYDGLAGRIAKARQALRAGKPLPSPAEIGLPLSAGSFRCRRADRTLRTPLEPNAPWLVNAATHRLALVVRAGKFDRTDLPIELDLALPAGLATRALRAFCRIGSGDASEIPAQLGPSKSPGRSRLTFVLVGLLPKNAAATVWAYFAPAGAPPALGGAASTRDAPKGMKVLENDKVRLVLGPEGAHVYRWQVKAAAGCDLTMPGESGWSGFSDMAGSYRGAPHRLACTARGPAMVRYTCTEPRSGLVKTISLFAGASWIEVTLSEPTGHYWDFDNPKNFAADGPTPGRYLFSTGTSGLVGRQADGVPAQVKVPRATWSVKFNEAGLALALLTPDRAASHRVAPGAGAGGVGIEASPAVGHFITYAGMLDDKPRAVMERLRQTLRFADRPNVTAHAVQKKGSSP